MNLQGFVAARGGLEAALLHEVVLQTAPIYKSLSSVYFHLRRKVFTKGCLCILSHFKV